MLARLPRLAAAVVAVAGFLTHAPRASADYVLDDFNNPSPGTIYQISLLNGTGPYTSPTTTVSSGVTRTVQVSVNTTPVNFNSVSGTIGGGVFTMDSDNSSAATSKITYALTGASRNLSGATGLSLNFLNLDPGTVPTGGTPNSVPVQVQLVTSTGTRTLNTTITGSGAPFTRDFDFSSFSGTGNMSQVNSIVFTINRPAVSQRAVDFALDGVSVKQVPAPPAVLLAGLGVLALLGRARLARKPAAA